jgi:hypothetical protein
LCPLPGGVQPVRLAVVLGSELPHEISAGIRDGCWI